MVSYKEEHRKLWNWLAAHPNKGKEDYFADWERDDIPENMCFACKSAAQNAVSVYGLDGHISFVRCKYCPLGGSLVVGCSRGLYADYINAIFPRERQRLALQIASLPWKGAEDNA